MFMDVMLPWFPVMLGAWIGGRFVGQNRATWFGVMCALYWVVIVQMMTRTPFWMDASLAASLLAGSAAIVGMVDWSSRSQSKNSERGTRQDDKGHGELARVSHAAGQFDEWLELKRKEDDPWASFEEFVRRTLHDVCGAMHIKPYRILTEGDILVPMRAIVVDGDVQKLSSRAGIMGHVATTGRSYYAQDASQGDLVRRLASQSSTSPQWCFAIRQGGRSIGVVSVGELGGEDCSLAFLRAIELSVSQFWGTLAEVCRGRMASDRDQVSGVLTRDSFIKSSQEVALSSYEVGEPVAMVVLAVEGHRRLLDLHLWDVANEVMRLVGQTLAGKLRPDDQLGRLDDTRFVVLLRRVDSALASLIARQLTEIVSEQLNKFLNGAGIEAGLHIRSGVAGSGTTEPDVERLLGQSVVLCHMARQNDLLIASDVDLFEEAGV